MLWFDIMDSSSEVIVIHLLLLLLVVSKVSPQYGSSPCPRVFSYQYDQQRGLYGVIRVFNNHNTRVQLNIEMSIGNRVQGYNGHIELSKPKDEVIDDVINYRPIQYKLFFPYWEGIPPQITKISVNGDLICSGPRIQRNLVPFITTINLQHTMKVDVLPLSYANGPEGNSIFHLEEEIPRNFGSFATRRENGDNSRTSRRRPPPDGPPLDGPPPGRPPPLRPPPGRPPPQYNPGRPVERPNNGGDSFRETDSLDGNRSDGIFKLNPNNPFFFEPTKDRSEEDDSTASESPLYPGNPFFLTSIAGPPTELKTTESTLNAPSTSHRDPDVSPVGIDDLPAGTPYRNICGRSVSTNALVIHGNEVPRGAYPWLAALFWVKPTGLNYMCGGSLISDRHVITAAHCTKKEKKILQPSDILVILGKLNIQKWVPSDGEKMVETESIHIHPDYTELSGDADVAILVLSEKMEFTIYIRPLCLWSGETELEKIVGFRNGTGPCNGDSGSGFIMQQQGKWMLRGVVSTSISDNGERTCDLKNYVVFTDVSKFYDWILSFIK